MILKKAFGNIDSNKAFYLITVVAMLMAWADYIYIEDTEFLAMMLIFISELLIFPIRKSVHAIISILPISFYYCWILVGIYRNEFDISIIPLSLCMICMWVITIFPLSASSYGTWKIANMLLWMDFVIEMMKWDYGLLQIVNDLNHFTDIVPYSISGVLRLNLLFCFILSTMLITKPGMVKWNERRFQNVGFVASLMILVWSGMSIVFGIFRVGGLSLWGGILLASLVFTISIAISAMSEQPIQNCVGHRHNFRRDRMLDFHRSFINSRWAYSIYDEEKILLFEEELGRIEKEIGNKGRTINCKSPSEYRKMMRRKRMILFILKEKYGLS